MGSLCEYVEWDSGFFRKRIAKVNKMALSAEEMSDALNWCKLENIDCMYFLADPHNIESLRLTEKNGFNMVDIRVTLEAMDLQRQFFRAPNEKVIVRDFIPADLPVLQCYASENHNNSRFFNDQRFSLELATELYALWIEKCCTVFNDKVFVAQYQDEVVGYITCRAAANGPGQIILAGVDQRNRSVGIGTRLVQESLRWFHGNGMKTATVVTQGTNIKALRLYTSWGFYPTQIELWYHRWFTKE